MTLTEFLLARIAEDEQTVADLRYTPRTHRDQMANPSDPMHANLTRALREAEAKRRIVEMWRNHGDADPEETLLHIASVYDSHPDYRDEWRP